MNYPEPTGVGRNDAGNPNREKGEFEEDPDWILFSADEVHSRIHSHAPFTMALTALASHGRISVSSPGLQADLWDSLQSIEYNRCKAT